MADYIPRKSKHDPNLQTVTHPSMHPIHGPTSVGRYNGTTVELRYFFFTTRSRYYRGTAVLLFHGTSTIKVTVLPWYRNTTNTTVLPHGTCQ